MNGECASSFSSFAARTWLLNFDPRFQENNGLEDQPQAELDLAVGGPRLDDAAGSGPQCRTDQPPAAGFVA
jgi:hypothetical protein